VTTSPDRSDSIGKPARARTGAPQLTADFEVVTPRLPVVPDRVEDLGLELAKARRLDPDSGRH